MHIEAICDRFEAAWRADVARIWRLSWPTAPAWIRRKNGCCTAF